MVRTSFRITTLGCKVNQQESEALAARFEALGLVPAGRGEAADICVVNSCTVTSVADSKTRQRIRQARAGNPGAFVCVIGCMPETAREATLAMPEVDLAIGSLDKDRTAEYVMEAIGRAGRDAQEDRDEAVDGRPGIAGGEGHRVAARSAGSARGPRTRAYIKAEDGCDRFCAYCIIPYARGAVRSRPEEGILREAGGLLGAGCRELVLTGVNLALYGRDRADVAEGGTTGLYRLVERLCSLGGGAGDEYRIRLGSLEPTVIGAAEAARIAGLRGVCPQFHLSLQSGAARTLEAMGRAYTPEGYTAIVRGLRGIDPLFSITTDVIVGFPGETEADFEESLSFVKRTGFSRVHVFKYSKRPGTRAAEMGGQVSEDEKNSRSRRMILAAGEGEAGFLARNEGHIRRTLVFGPVKGGRFIRGITDNGIDVMLPVEAGPFTPNTFIDLKLGQKSTKKPE